MSLTVLVLAGGESRRMGSSKAWLEFDGTPLVEHVARRLLPLASEVLFSAAPDERFAPVIARLPIPARVVPDVYAGAGPLAGLHAGLRASHGDATLAVATDMPFVNPALIAHMLTLAAGCDVVAPLTPVEDAAEPQPEPLHALYRPTCLPAIEQALAEGRRRMVSFFPAVNVCYLQPAKLAVLDPALLSFRNVNTPEEWHAAQALLRAGKTNPL